MRCDKAYIDMPDHQIIIKTAEWCGASKKTVKKLIDNSGSYPDQRSGPNSVTRVLTQEHRGFIIHKISSSLKVGIPVTTRHLITLLEEEMGTKVSKPTLCRTLMAWNIRYEELRVKDIRKDRDYVKESLDYYLKYLKKNHDLTC